MGKDKKEKKVKAVASDAGAEPPVAKKVKKEKKLAKAAVEASASGDVAVKKDKKKDKKDKKKAPRESPRLAAQAAAVADVPEETLDKEESEEEAQEVEGFKVHKYEPPPEPEDETLQCRDCSADFIFTIGEQEFFKSKGFTNKKTRCAECTAAKKARFGEESGKGSGKGKGKGKGDSGKGKGKGGGAMSCYNCGEEGHMSRDCPKERTGGGGGGGMNCYNCGEDGHMSRDCPKPREGGKSGGGVCYAFQKGECTRGDSCKFAHSQ